MFKSRIQLSRGTVHNKKALVSELMDDFQRVTQFVLLSISALFKVRRLNLP
jgi:hypothetical protein